MRSPGSASAAATFCSNGNPAAFAAPPPPFQYASVSSQRPDPGGNSLGMPIAQAIKPEQSQFAVNIFVGSKPPWPSTYVVVCSSPVRARCRDCSILAVFNRSFQFVIMHPILTANCNVNFDVFVTTNSSVQPLGSLSLGGDL